MNKGNLKLKRKFLGFSLDNLSYKMSTFDKKHLKAYLKGYTRFKFGRDSDGEPIYHEVKQELKVIEDENISNQ